MLPLERLQSADGHESRDSSAAYSKCTLYGRSLRSVSQTQSVFLTFNTGCTAYATTHLLETSAKVVAEGGVNKWIEATVEEARPVSGEHREQKLRLVQETVRLQLRDRRDGVERSPAQPERQRY